MTIQELLAAFDLSPNQRTEMYVAYDENPKGFERVAKRAAEMNNPPAALTSMIRKGAHLKAEEQASKGKPASDTLDDLAAIAVRAYRARIAKYPPVDERGWTDDDAITYGVFVASTWSNRAAQDDIERAMRILIGKPWTKDQDPLLGTGCPPELLERIKRGITRIGVIEKPAPTPEPDLVARLRKALEEAA